MPPVPRSEHTPIADMLAYVFWHAARSGVENAVYEATLVHFHAALAATHLMRRLSTLIAVACSEAVRVARTGIGGHALGGYAGDEFNRGVAESAARISVCFQ